LSSQRTTTPGERARGCRFLFFRGLAGRPLPRPFPCRLEVLYPVGSAPPNRPPIPGTRPARNHRAEQSYARPRPPANPAAATWVTPVRRRRTCACPCAGPGNARAAGRRPGVRRRRR